MVRRKTTAPKNVKRNDSILVKNIKDLQKASSSVLANEDIERTNHDFYQPMSLSKLVENCPGIEVDSSNEESSLSAKERNERKKQKELEDDQVEMLIQKHRKRKITEDLINQDKLKIINARKKEKNQDGSTKIYGQYDVLGRPLHIDINYVDNNAKMKKVLPSSYPNVLQNQIHEETHVSKVEKRKTVTEPNQIRPASGRSQMTTNTFPTANQTAISGPTSMPLGQPVIIDKNSKLVDFIRFDSTLGREQNIQMGKESSLSNAEQMRIQEGVVLKQFAPFKDMNIIEDEQIPIEERLKSRFESAEYQNRKVTFEN